MYDIIIVGAGPAGLTAAIYAGRAKKKVLILEAKSYGGQIINTQKVDNYPGAPHISGYDFATKLYNQAKEFGAEILFEKVIKINNTTEYKEVITTKNTYKGKTLILATGRENRKLGLENENELIGKGVSYCATCDGPFYKNQDVAIQGGGNSALEEAIYLSDIVKTVYLIHRRDTFRAESILVDKIKEKENIKVILNSTITKLNGKEQLESITVKDNNESEQTIDVKCVFVAVGQIPENENFRTLINLDDNGYVIAQENCKTNIDGIYVAGDARTKDLRQLVTATSDGATSATEAIKYINKKTS